MDCYPLKHLVSVLRRTGLAEVADEAERTLPDPVDSETADRFCAAHGLSKDSLMNRMGGSP
jgi:hypothetical protein